MDGPLVSCFGAFLIVLGLIEVSALALHDVELVTRSDDTFGPGILACLPTPKSIIFVEETYPFYKEIKDRFIEAGDDREKLKAVDKFVLECRAQEEMGVLDLRLNDIEYYFDRDNSVFLRTNTIVHITFTKDDGYKALQHFLKNKERKSGILPI